MRGSLELPGAKAKKKKNTLISSGQDKTAAKTPKPHKPFVLDGLLR